MSATQTDNTNVNNISVNVGGSVGYLPFKRQSIMAHTMLLLFTGGVGNFFYAWHVVSYNGKVKRNARRSARFSY